MSRPRSDFLRGARGIVPLMPAAVSFGLVVGAAVREAGAGLAESLALSATVYGGAAQLAATTLWREGAPALVAIATALVVNARFLIYSVSIAPELEGASWTRRFAGAFLLRDGAYALAMTKGGRGTTAFAPFYLGAAFIDYAVWLLATTAGVLGAAFVPASWSLDFVVPLVFLALLAGALEKPADYETALVTALAAGVLVPLLPLQSGVVAAIGLGVLWGAFRHRDATEGTPS